MLNVCMTMHDDFIILCPSFFQESTHDFKQIFTKINYLQEANHAIENNKFPHIFYSFSYKYITIMTFIIYMYLTFHILDTSDRSEQIQSTGFNHSDLTFYSDMFSCRQRK